jgi:hypothetical protein
MITLPFGNFLRYEMILLPTLRCPSLVEIIILLIAEVSYANTNVPKKIIIQMRMQQPILGLYLVESYSVQGSESSTSGWYS